MTKLSLWSLLVFILHFSACSPAPAPSLDSATTPATPSPTTSPSPGAVPSKTPRPTQTPTPLPDIPTITPTFNAQTVVTVTPDSAAVCPVVTPVTHPDIDFLDTSIEKLDNIGHIEQNILNFLNHFGASALAKAMEESSPARHAYLQDLTGDGVAEFMVYAFSTYIFGCQNGQYVTLLALEPDAYLQSPKITNLEDINQNGLPNLTILVGTWSQGGHAYAIYEWNGAEFANLIPSDQPDYPNAGEIWVEATGKIHYEDVDSDTIQELILDSGIPVWETYYSGLPWRNKRTAYRWNGTNYLPGKVEFAQPEFRFQAVQDADLAVGQEEYAKALALYQQTIFSDQLKAYSPEIRKHLQALWISSPGDSASQLRHPWMPPNTRAWQPTLIIVWSSCTLISTKQMQLKPNTSPCKINFRQETPAIPIPRWQLAFGTHTKLQRTYPMLVPPPSPLPTHTPRF